MRVRTYLTACLCLLVAVGAASSLEAQSLDLTKLKKAAQQLLKEPKKLDPSKWPKKLTLKISAKLEPPKEASKKQTSKVRLASYVSTSDLKKLRSELEKGASSAAKREVEEAREYVRQRKLGFEVGVTSASGVPLKHLAGTLPPSAEELARQPEQAAIAGTIAKRWREASTRQKSSRAALGSTVDASGAPSPNASYYAMSSGGAAAASWMDSKSYPLPRTCDPKGTRWVARDALPPVRHQGNCGSCWAFSAVSAFEVSQAYLNGVFHDFSEQSMLNCAVTSLGKEAGNCSGGWPHNVYDFVGRSGPATEAQVPYVSQKRDCASNTLTAYTGVTYAPIDPQTVRADPSKLKNALCQYGSISTIVPATNAFNSYIGGVFKEPNVTYWDNNAHAVVLVGWDDEKRAWLLRNSWGVGWGEAGYMWVDYETYAAADARYRGNEYWVVAAPGDGGSKGQGSSLGAWYTRVPRFENATGQPLTLRVQYAAWTGIDGMRWLPQADSWYSYAIPAGFRGELGSPFIGSLRASKVLLYAESTDGTKQWTHHQTTPIDLVPEGGYWAEAAEPFDIKIDSDAIVQVSQPAAAVSSEPTSTSCTSFHVSRIAFSAAVEYEWDVGDAPDIFLELKNDKTTLRSPVGLDNFDHAWDFIAADPLVLTAGAKITLTAYDKDLNADEVIDSISATVPKTFPSGTWKTVGKYGEMELSGTCASLRPSVVGATLPSSTRQLGKLYFGGSATDAAGLSALAATVSGPKGKNLPLFSDTKVSGTSKSLSAYFFDSSASKYAGVAGTYTIVLQATNGAGLTGSKSFQVEVELPPSLASATLAPSMNHLGALQFGGSVIDDVGLKTIAATVSGPKGKDLPLFGDTNVSGASKSLAAYSFDSADARYAGIAGTYTVVLSATDNAGLVGSKTFKVTVNLPPSLADVTLPTWVPNPDKIAFFGSATDDVALKAITATVSGPRGKNLPLFNDTKVTAASKSLAAYSFDSADTTYAGKVGTYTIELSATDSSGLTVSKTFSVAVANALLPSGSPVSAGSSHSCAVRKNGEVICWGAGVSGRLGNGSTRSSNYPLPVSDLVDAVSVSAGDSHTCAVKKSGEVVCFGAGASGRLGNGATRNSNVPVSVSNLVDAISVSAGASHTCAVKKSGEVVCWGAGASGRLGNGTTRNSNVPLPVSGLVDAVSVSVGTSHACAVRKSGEMVCWGAGASGQLGHGATRSSSVPVRVSNLVDAISVSASQAHTCAVRAGGEVVCFGAGGSGRLGNGATRNSSVPVLVSNLVDAVSVSAGASHACAVRQNKDIVCWGAGAGGRLGNSSTRNSNVAVSVSGLSDAMSVSAGLGHTCALQNDGKVACWGTGGSGRLGNGTTRNSNDSLPISDLADAVSVSIGTAHTCAVRPNGAVFCWGAGGSGRLGNGAMRNSSVPVPVTDLADATSVGVGSAHTCAVRSNGEVACWGAGGSGRLGNGATRNSSVPVSVTDLMDAASLRASSTHTCAARKSGEIACWGSGKFNGGPTRTSSIPIAAN